MTATVELERFARGHVPPSRASNLHAIVVSPRPGPSVYGLAWYIDGLRPSAPIFTGSQSDVARLFDIFTGRVARPASRSALDRAAPITGADRELIGTPAESAADPSHPGSSVPPAGESGFPTAAEPARSLGVAVPPAQVIAPAT